MNIEKQRDPGRDHRGIIAIIGFMGAGKSTVGALLAYRLHLDAVDLDELIAARTGKSIREIFAEEGEQSFRDHEHQALKGELEKGGKIISCGGGVVLREENVRLLRGKCRVFYLKISPQEAVRRLEGEGERPLLEGGKLEETVKSLLKDRAERYLKTAHEVIEADDLSPEEIAEEMAERWRRYRSTRPGETTRSS